MFNVDQQARYQNLASRVKGRLNKNFDALHAFLAAINPSLVSGIPKIKSMQLLGKLEKGKRSFISGSLVHISPEKNMTSMTIEPIRIKKDKAFIRTSSRVFYNSNDKEEFRKSEEKVTNILDAIKSAGGLK